jgi:bifunctional pyridoxal-dependent enzyme with beta-cystathionase and maltose regulon repressor activities
MSHTPGWWTVDDDTLDILAVTIGDAPAYIACQPAYPSGRPLTEEELAANLRLICAAPDLLAACQAMAHDIRATHFTDGEHRLSEDAARQMLQFLERVISKGTEETNGKERSLD